MKLLKEKVSQMHMKSHQHLKYPQQITAKFGVAQIKSLNQTTDENKSTVLDPTNKNSSADDAK